MIQLSTPSDKAIRAQIAESISLIASADFPDRWSDLIDVSPTRSIACLVFMNARHTEPRQFPVPHQLRHQHRCATNRTLHFLLLAGGHSLRRVVHRHQSRTQELQQTTPTTTAAHFQSSSH